MPDYQNVNIAPNSAAQALDESLDVSLPDSGSGIASESQRFESLLQDGVGIPGIEESLVPFKLTPVYAHSMGDAILQRLDSMGAAFRTHMEKTQQMIEATPNSFSLQDLIKLQLEMASVSLEIEVVGKGVQKAVQHADQLSKLQ